jgi:long-chain acyl-CoA synthetase
MSREQSHATLKTQHFADFLLGIFEEKRHNPAILGYEFNCSYYELLSLVHDQTTALKKAGLKSGCIVLLRGDFTPIGIASLISLIRIGCICIPYTGDSPATLQDVLDIGQVEAILNTTKDGNWAVEFTSTQATHEHYYSLRKTEHPGLVLFSSGSSGKSKGTVHDFSRLLIKYTKRRQDLRTLAFLLFDHIGGLDTLFYTLSNGSPLVVVSDRSPGLICDAIQDFHVEVLPTTPTFLNLVFISQATKARELKSLRYITYGAEVMPQQTLDRCREAFPNAQILQKYGTSEIGTLHSRSKSNSSVWMQIGGEGFDYRVVGGILQIRAQSAMLGYLNAESPFTDDGWFITGDRVEVDGDFIRVVGRESDLINVGGKKVYPTEVESEILQMDNIADVAVFRVPNAIFGNVVGVRIQLLTPESPQDLRIRLRKFLSARLDAYKLPSLIELTEQIPINERGKRLRRSETPESR